MQVQHKKQVGYKPRSTRWRRAISEKENHGLQQTTAAAAAAASLSTGLPAMSSASLDFQGVIYLQLVGAATTFQAAWRGYYFRKQKKSATKLQAHFRGYKARKTISSPTKTITNNTTTRNNNICNHVGGKKNKYVYYFE